LNTIQDANPGRNFFGSGQMILSNAATGVHEERCSLRR